MPWAIDHVDIGDVIPLTAHQCRQETMETIEIRQCEEHLAPERLKSAPGVTGAGMQDGIAHAIGDARLKFLEAGVLASHPLTRGEANVFAAVFDGRNQSRQKS